MSPAPVVILFNTHFVSLAKFPIDGLACPFLYCSCDLSLYHRPPFRSNISYCTKPHRTRPSSSSGQRNSRMDICLQRGWDRSSFHYNWRDGFKIRYWKFTTFVRIPFNRLVSFIHLFFFRRLLSMMIIMGTIWAFVPKKSNFTCWDFIQRFGDGFTQYRNEMFMIDEFFIVNFLLQHEYITAESRGIYYLGLLFSALSADTGSCKLSLLESMSLEFPPCIFYLALSSWELPALESRQTQHKSHYNITHTYRGISSKNQIEI